MQIIKQIRLALLLCKDVLVYLLFFAKPAYTSRLSLMRRARIVKGSTSCHFLKINPEKRPESYPQISCILIRTQNFAALKAAIRCFQNQTYPNKELIIVDGLNDNQATMHLRELNDSTITYIQPDSGSTATLDFLQHTAIKHASGEYICLWTDTHLSDAMRLSRQMKALQLLNVNVCFLERCFLWFSQEKYFAVSVRRPWDESMLCEKSILIGHTVKHIGKNSPEIVSILQSHNVALLDEPQLFTDIIKGNDLATYQEYWSRNSRNFTPGSYDRILKKIKTRFALEKDCIAYLQPQSMIFSARQVARVRPRTARTFQCFSLHDADAHQDGAALPNKIVFTSKKKLDSQSQDNPENKTVCSKAEKQRIPGRKSDSVILLESDSIDPAVLMGKRYRVGIVVTTYNRPQYLEPMLESLKESLLEESITVIVDDCSNNKASIDLIRNFSLCNSEVLKIFKSQNKGVADSLRSGWELLRGQCEFLCNLDSDVLLKPDWLKTLSSVHEEYIRTHLDSHIIVTGFNADSHRTLLETNNFVTKETIGGINLFFDNSLYEKYFQSALKYKYWDHRVIDNFYGWELSTTDKIRVKGIKTPNIPEKSVLICTKPSVVQHIGIDGLHGGIYDCDYAQDF